MGVTPGRLVASCFIMIVIAIQHNEGMRSVIMWIKDTSWDFDFGSAETIRKGKLNVTVTAPGFMI